MTSLRWLILPFYFVCNPQVRIVGRDLGMEEVAAKLHDDPSVIV